MLRDVLRRRCRLGPVNELAASFVLSVALLLVTAAGPSPIWAQEGIVDEVFRLSWNDGAAAALDRWSSLPDSQRSVDILIQLADQLIWTGKHPESVQILERAAAAAPSSTEVQLQLARARLQSGQREAATRALRTGTEVVGADPRLSVGERERLQRELQDRLALLRRSDDLTSRIGPYRASDGGFLLFKYDPYLNTIPQLVDMETGSSRVLHPGPAEDLVWRTDDGEVVGVVRWRGEAGNAGELVVRTPDARVVAPGLGVGHETLRFRRDSVSIEATLLRPVGAEAVPAVVLTHGAGLSTRYNLALEAAAFASAGIAALIFDKPGLGRSTGANWLLLSIQDQADFVREAINQLRSRDDIAHIGVWGFSQGGWVAPLAVAGPGSADFLLLASAAPVSPQEQDLQSRLDRMRAEDLPAEQIDSAVAYTRNLWDRVNAGATLEEIVEVQALADSATWGSFVPKMRMEFELTWWRENEIDPAADLERLAIPTLALFGERDSTVPPELNAPLLTEHLARAPTGDYTIVVLPNADHRFMTGGDYNPLYFQVMTDWVGVRFLESDSMPFFESRP